MLNLVSRTTASVSGTVSSVASVATGGIRQIVGRDTKKQSDGESTEEFIMQNARDKAAITIKATPSKDGLTTSKLATKKGNFLKRNEQGQWQRRLVCMVPHLFLYYFDNDSSSDARGIIDLHFYTDVCVEGHDNNILKLSPPDGTGLKPFFFQIDDANEMSEWMTALHRERYEAIKDERDQYQQLQEQFSNSMFTAKTIRDESAKEIEQLVGEADMAKRHADEARQTLNRVLVILRIPEEEMAKLLDINSIGETLIQKFNQLQESLDSVIQENTQTRLEEEARFTAQVASIEEQLGAERRTRQELEATLVQVKRESEARVRDFRGEIEKANLNMQMAIAAKATFETKSATLQEQKKVLVKEVKSQRRKLEQSNESVSQLKALNDRLTAAVSLLQEQQKSLSARLEAATLNQTALASGVGQNGPLDLSSFEATGMDASALGAPSVDRQNKLGSDEMQALLGDLGFPNSSMTTSESPSLKPAASLDHSDASGGTADSRGRDRQRNRRTSYHQSERGGSTDGLGRESLPAQCLTEDDLEDEGNEDDEGDDEDEDEDSDSGGHGFDDHDDGKKGSPKKRSSWGIPPMELRELGWLSSEQRQLVEGRLTSCDGGETAAAAPAGEAEPGLASTSSDSATATAGSGSMDGVGSLTSSAMAVMSVPSSFFATSSGSSVTGTGSGPNSPTSATTSAAKSVSSFSAFGSMFAKDKVNSAPALLSQDLLDPSEHPATAASTANSASISAGESPSAAPVGSFFDSPLPSNVEPTPEPAKLRCLRCKGTVEGPKYSTCKCIMPALTPEDLASSAGSTAPAGSSTTSSFLGIFSKGSQMAGGLAGGLAGVASSAAGGLAGAARTATSTLGKVASSSGPSATEPTTGAFAADNRISISSAGSASGGSDNASLVDSEEGS